MSLDFPLDFPWDSPPAANSTGVELRTVVTGLQWMRLPLPFALDHVNVWLLADHDATLIIDTGVSTDVTVALWEDALGQLPPELSGVLITHYHPDHAGLAGWFAERNDMTVWFTRQEWEFANAARDSRNEEFSTNQDNWYRQHGLDEKRRAAMARVGNSYRPYVHELGLTPVFLSANDTLRIGDTEWRVITAGGHSPEMICLYSESLNILIAADQLLPTITPNVSLNFYTKDPDPLGTFLDHLRLFSGLPDDVLVLPSHGLPFRGLSTRVTRLRAHHEQRFAELCEHCVEPQSATDVLPVLFRRKLDYQQLMFAMGESIAHMNHLALNGLLERVSIGNVEHFVRS